MTNWAVEWNTTWSARVFFDAIDIVWPKGVQNAVDFSIESQFNKEKLHTFMSTVLDDIIHEPS